MFRLGVYDEDKVFLTGLYFSGLVSEFEVLTASPNSTHYLNLLTITAAGGRLHASHLLRFWHTEKTEKNPAQPSMSLEGTDVSADSWATTQPTVCQSCCFSLTGFILVHRAAGSRSLVKSQRGFRSMRPHSPLPHHHHHPNVLCLASTGGCCYEPPPLQQCHTLLFTCMIGGSSKQPPVKGKGRW